MERRNSYCYFAKYTKVVDIEPAAGKAKPTSNTTSQAAIDSRPSCLRSEGGNGTGSGTNRASVRIQDSKSAGQQRPAIKDTIHPSLHSFYSIESHLSQRPSTAIDSRPSHRSSTSTDSHLSHRPSTAIDSHLSHRPFTTAIGSRLSQRPSTAIDSRRFCLLRSQICPVSCYLAWRRSSGVAKLLFWLPNPLLLLSVGYRGSENFCRYYPHIGMQGIMAHPRLAR
jgi:hypothetical protein